MTRRRGCWCTCAGLRVWPDCTLLAFDLAGCALFLAPRLHTVAPKCRPPGAAPQPPSGAPCSNPT